MSNALAIVPLGDLQIMADAIAKSGLFGMKSHDQALALMLVAQSEGQHPATITQDYDIIQGKACRKTHSVMARFQQMGGRVEWHQLTSEIADATFSHPAGGSLRIEWTFDQAKKAGLTNKDNWKNYPRAMLRARLIAEGIRTVYPAAIGGMLIAEEAQDAPDREIDVTPRNSHPADQRVIEQAEPYPADQFAKNMPKWSGLIQSGKKTADDIIKTVQSKAPMTAEQLAAIRAVKVAEQESPAGDAVTFAQVAEKLNRADCLDVLDVAADLIGEVSDAAQRAELSGIYQERAEAFAHIQEKRI